MIKRRNFLKLMAAPAVMTVALPGFALAKEKVTYAYLLDPAYDAVTWAMSNGKVTSDLIEVEARGLAIPQLIQATSAKQYDVIMTAVIAIPPAAARGLELKVLSTALQQSRAGEGAGVWVKSDSPIKNPKELKGKTLGSYALRSTGYTQVRFALIKKYGLNAALEGGDLKQVEIQAPNLPGGAGRRPDRRRDADSQPGLSRSEVGRVPIDRRDRTRQHRSLRHALHQRAQCVISGTSGAAARTPSRNSTACSASRCATRSRIVTRCSARSASRTICRRSSSTGGSRRARMFLARSRKATPRRS